MEEKTKTCQCGCEDEECDCGCEEDPIVELEADDGRKLKFYLVGTLDFEGKDYAAFEPAEEVEGVEMGTLVIFELNEQPDGAAELLPVEDQDLLERVYNAFCEEIEGECCDDDCDCEDGCHDEGCTCGCHDEK